MLVRQSTLLLSSLAIVFFTLLIAVAELQETSAAERARVVLAIEGMSCGSCAETIENALKKLEGVEQANVDFAKKQAAVIYDASKVKPARMTEEITKLGFRAKVADG